MRDCVLLYLVIWSHNVNTKTTEHSLCASRGRLLASDESKRNREVKKGKSQEE